MALLRLQNAGLKLGIATSEGREAAEMLPAHLSILGLFETSVGPEDVEHPKPHPEPVRRLMELLGVSSESMVSVGDYGL